MTWVVVTSEGAGAAAAGDHSPTGEGYSPGTRNATPPSVPLPAPGLPPRPARSPTRDEPRRAISHLTVGDTMGLLDDLLAGMLSQGGLQGSPQGGTVTGQVDPSQAGQPQITRSQLAGLAQAAIAMLNDPRVGGIDGILRRCQQAGLGDIV